MQIKKVIEAIAKNKYSSNLYDWRRDSHWRVTIAIYDNGKVEIPSRPPLELKTRYFNNIEQAYLWVEKKYGLKPEDFIEKRMPRFVCSDPCDPPQGGPVFFNWRKHNCKS